MDGRSLGDALSITGVGSKSGRGSQTKQTDSESQRDSLSLTGTGSIELGISVLKVGNSNECKVEDDAVPRTQDPVTQEEETVDESAEEEILVVGGDRVVHDASRDRFGEYIEALQDMCAGDVFGEIQEQFFQKYHHEFEDTEENKLSYMPIFQEWSQTMENHLVEYLSSHVSGFDEQEFMDLCDVYRDEIDETILDFLTSLTDFAHFKELMLDYKRSLSLDLGDIVTIHSLQQGGRVKPGSKEESTNRT